MTVLLFDGPRVEEIREQMAKHSKQYIAKTELVEKDKPYELEEAVAVLKQSATAKFDETVELHIKTGADPRHAEQLVRGVCTSPAWIR